jgi:hypothetical protein
MDPTVDAMLTVYAAAPASDVGRGDSRHVDGSSRGNPQSVEPP